MLRSVLSLALVLLAAAAYHVVWRTPAPGKSMPRAADVTTLAVGTPAPAPFERELPALASLSMTVERPLFVQTRRPGGDDEEATSEAVTKVEQGSTPADLPNFVLSAVFRTAGAELVLLQDLASGEVRSVRLGETFGGWRVTRIESKRVVLERNAVSHTLALHEAASRVTGNRPVPPPANATVRLRRLPPGSEDGNADVAGRAGVVVGPESVDEGEIQQ